MKVMFGLRKLGAKSDADEAEDEAEGFGGVDEKPKSDELGDAGAHVAVRAFVKALGVDPGSVDMKKATKALKAFVATCKRDDAEEDEEY